MISRASRMLTERFTDSAHMSQLYSTVLYNLVFGELIQAKRDIQSSKSSGALSGSVEEGKLLDE